MSYLLYDKNTQKIIWSGSTPYMVDGKPGELTDNIIELKAVFDLEPTFDAKTQYLSQSIAVDLDNKLYKTSYSVNDNPIIVPDEIPLWAFRTAIRKSGLKESIEFLLNALPEPQKTDAWEHYEYGNYILRNHPLILALASQLGLTEKQVDDVFLLAQSLS